MNGWEVWLALIVAAAVWILGHLLRQGGDDAGKRGPAGRPEGRPARPAAPPGRSQSSTELDRFLQEVARRKQAAEQQRTREPAPAPPRRPVRPREESPDRPPRRRMPEAIPQVLPAEPVRQRPSVERPLERVVPLVRPTPRAEPPVAVVPVEPAEVVLPAPAVRLFPPARRDTVSPTLQKLAAMLRSRDDLRAGIVLREILQPPLCHRRRR
jgi:hypothetical protein